MTEIIRSTWMNDEGQDLVEYALIIALVSILIVASLTALRTGIAAVFTRIVTCMSTGTC